MDLIYKNREELSFLRHQAVTNAIVTKLKAGEEVTRLEFAWKIMLNGKEYLAVGKLFSFIFGY